MNLALFGVVLGELTIVQWALAILVIAGVIGIVMVCLKQMGIAVPPFIIQILWILLAVVVGAAAIKFVASIF